MTHARPLVLLAAVSFALHLLWERAHIVLYSGYEALEGYFPVYLYATFGDVMYTVLAVALIALITHRTFSPRRGDYILYAVFGLCIAFFVEWKARVLDRWEYTDAMPVIAGFGLSPLIQMSVLIPLSVYIVVRLEKWLNTRI